MERNAHSWGGKRQKLGDNTDCLHVGRISIRGLADILRTVGEKAERGEPVVCSKQFLQNQNRIIRKHAGDTLLCLGIGRSTISIGHLNLARLVQFLVAECEPYRQLAERALARYPFVL